MLAVTCVVAVVVVPPTELPEQASNAASAALWLSNFQFAFWNVDYFAPQSDTALFLHTWSLGVEEQFYLVWPLLVVAAVGAWKYARNTSNLARLKWLFGAIFIASFALSLYWTYRSPLLAFYMMPSRAWQFALGAIVFLVVGSPAYRLSSVVAKSVWLRPAGWLGLVMILLAALVISRSAPYPGTWALLPSFGAALVLAAGAQQQTWAGRLLSWWPIQALGRVSYSWYLWHWPVLLLGATLLNTANGWNLLLLVVISLLLAGASYRYFETPIRHNRELLTKPGRAVLAGLAVMIVAELSLQGWKAEAKSFARSPAFARFIAAGNDKPIVYRMSCWGSSRSAKAKVCAFGDPHATHTAVLMGDSKALHWFPAYRPIFDKPGWRLLTITKSGCPVVDEPLFDLPLRREYTECAQWRRDAVRKVVSLHPDLVVLGESFTYPFTEAQWIEGTRKVLSALEGHTQHIYFMRPTPELRIDGPLCLEPRGRMYYALVSKMHCAANAHTARFDDVGRWLKMALAPFKDVQFVDMTNNVCAGGICRAEVNGSIVFSDTGHMTATFARTLAPALAATLRLPSRRALDAAAHAESQ
jgi:peptidoglycan/LPS O-acetylase OafA/YrhL